MCSLCNLGSFTAYCLLLLFLLLSLLSISDRLILLGFFVLFCFCEATVLSELLQVVRVSSQLADECSSSDLVLDVLVQQLHVLVNAVDARLLI